MRLVADDHLLEEEKRALVRDVLADLHGGRGRELGLAAVAVVVARSSGTVAAGGFALPAAFFGALADFLDGVLAMVMKLC